jgi:hypothetical protein
MRYIKKAGHGIFRDIFVIFSVLLPMNCCVGCTIKSIHAKHEINLKHLIYRHSQNSGILSYAPGFKGIFVVLKALKAFIRHICGERYTVI